MTIVYARCNGGHYFVGERCPFDGWTSPEVVEIHEASTRLRRLERIASLDALRELGVREPSLLRCVVVEFGNRETTFDAAAIGEYFKDGDRFDWTNIPPSFM